jgi:hypothetical protein
MPENSLLRIEAGQTPFPMAALTDSGDHTTFAGTTTKWSSATGKAEILLPNGIRSGGTVTPKTAVNNQVTVSALEANLNGVITSVAGGDVTVVRTAAGGAFQKNSLTVTSAGALVNVAGTEGTSFSDTRAAAGGPPLIPTDSIEVAQVWFNSNTDAPVATSEIYAVEGLHRETASYPLWSVDAYGGRVTFVTDLPLIHTGNLPKRVYGQVFGAILQRVPNANNVKLPERTYTVNSEQDYDGVSASVGSSLNQASFDVKFQDGISDLVARQKGQKLWFEFYPDRNKTAHAVFQGVLGIDRSNPADGRVTAACTVSCEQPATEVQG